MACQITQDDIQLFSQQMNFLPESYILSIEEHVAMSESANEILIAMSVHEFLSVELQFTIVVNVDNAGAINFADLHQAY